MIRHIVMWKLKTQDNGKLPAEQALDLKMKLEALKNHISQIKYLEVGINMPDSPYDNFDCILDSVFENTADLEIYLKHPLHKEVADWISTVRELRAAVDYPYDPGIHR